MSGHRFTQGQQDPGFTYVLRAVLTNSPNSCPPERHFSIFNATYNDDQKSSHADYINLSIQSQFNKPVVVECLDRGGNPVVVECLDRGRRGGIGEGVRRLVLV